jgi:putative FmdB family regulatory protein
MPTYEYVCKDCKKIFAVLITMAEHEKRVKPACQYCGSRNVEQNYSSVTVITSKKG